MFVAKSIFEDVLNEITTFGGPMEPQNLSETIQERTRGVWIRTRSTLAPLIYFSGSDSSVFWQLFRFGARYPQTGARYPQRFRAPFTVELMPLWLETNVWALFWSSKMSQEQSERLLK